MVDTGLIFSLQLDDPQSKFWALLVLFELCMFIKFKFPKDNVLWIPPVGLLIIAITIDCINMSNFIDTYEACLYFACSYTAQLILSSDSHHLTDSMLILFTCPRERLLRLVIMGYSCSKRIAFVIVAAAKLENCLVSFVWEDSGCIWFLLSVSYHQLRCHAIWMCMSFNITGSRSFYWYTYLGASKVLYCWIGLTWNY